MPLPKPKKKPDAALLIAEPVEERPDEEMAEEGFDEEDDFGNMPEEDPLAAEGEDPFAAEASIDPEQAALAETLGFTEPDQQQALIDLIKLVTSQDSMSSTESGSALPPLPESTY